MTIKYIELTTYQMEQILKLVYKEIPKDAKLTNVIQVGNYRYVIRMEFPDDDSTNREIAR